MLRRGRAKPSDRRQVRGAVRARGPRRTRPIRARARDRLQSGRPSGRPRGETVESGRTTRSGQSDG